MERFVTSTQLKQELRAVKEYASQGVVHVLEHGKAAYVLCSAEVFEARLEAARSWGAWTAAVRDCLARSRRDVSQGRVSPLGETLGIDEMVLEDAYVTNSSGQAIRDLLAPAANLTLEAILDACELPSNRIAVEYDPSLQGDVLGTVCKQPVANYDLLCTRDVPGHPLLICGIVRSFALPTNAPDLERILGRTKGTA